MREEVFDLAVKRIDELRDIAEKAFRMSNNDAFLDGRINTLNQVCNILHATQEYSKNFRLSPQKEGKE